jgi:hypothetical protein
VGGGFIGGPARQRSDLSRGRGADSAVRTVVLSLLAVDGIICALATALFLPLYIGSVPFPISAVIAGALNLALVWAGLQWTTSTRLAALPLWTWLLTVALLTLGGPGGDIIFGGNGIRGLAPILLIVVGAGPAAGLLWRHQRPVRRRL